MKLLLIIICSLMGAYFVYLVVLYFFTGVPIILTKKTYFSQIFKELPVPKNSVLFELGCGKADFLFQAEKFGPKKLIGYELSPLHAFFANIKAKISGSKVKVYRRNFFEADISDADYIYLFLVKDIVDKTWKKIINETKKGTVVLVLSDSISGQMPFKVFKSRPGAGNSTLFCAYRVG